MVKRQLDSSLCSVFIVFMSTQRASQANQIKFPHSLPFTDGRSCTTQSVCSTTHSHTLTKDSLSFSILPKVVSTFGTKNFLISRIPLYHSHQKVTNIFHNMHRQIYWKFSGCIVSTEQSPAQQSIWAAYFLQMYFAEIYHKICTRKLLNNIHFGREKKQLVSFPFSLGSV